MKFVKIFTLLLLVSLSTGIVAQKTSTKKSNKTYLPAKTVTTNNPGVHMTFVNEHQDLGKVKKGEIKKFDIVFTNTGSETITIDIASGCDCTTLDYPKNAIKVGEKGTIHVTFDSGQKDESEVIDVDIYLKNLNPKTGQRILKVVDYKYELIK